LPVIDARVYLEGLLPNPELTRRERRNDESEDSDRKHPQAEALLIRWPDPVENRKRVPFNGSLCCCCALHI